MGGVYNAQFFRLDLRLLDSEEFLAFMRTPAFAVYFQLARYVWRGRAPHPIERVNQLFAEGYLVAAVDRETIASKLGLNQPTHVSRLLSELEKLRVIERVRTGRQSVYVLGRWEDRSFAGDRSYVVEIFYLHQRFGPDATPQIVVDGEAGEAADVHGERTSEVQKNARRPSDVHGERTSDVRKNAHRPSDVRRERTSDVHGERTSDVRKNARRPDSGSDVRVARTSDVRAACTSILNREDIDREGSTSDLSLSGEGEGGGVRAIARALEAYGRRPPGRKTIERWLDLCGGSEEVVVACLERLGRGGHLDDKPDEYLRAAIERAGREAARRGSGSQSEAADDEDVYVVR